MTRKAMERRSSGEAGFTLVELLVVIVVLGVLASVVVFAVGGISGKSKGAACKSDVATVQTASDAYYALNNAYAADIPALVTANLLKSAPVTTNGYTIGYAASTGVVTASPACSSF